MALVFRGWHVLLEQPIAIKVLKQEYVGNPEAVARFLREARATARLQGRHVAHVFDIGKFEGRTPFMVTELLNGSDLGKLLRAGAFSPERAVATLVAACDAVLQVHAAGIVHRDLKPDNLFVDVDSSGLHVKILDFGVAKPFQSGPVLTLPERGVGSPHYMSPEQIMTPLDVDFRSDVWSLGVVLFELLTAHMPFSGVTIPDLCKAIVRTDVSALSRPHALPAALDRIISKCLEKDRVARFQSVAELREALLDAQREITAAKRPDPAVRRPRGMLLLASFVACALSFASVVLLFDSARARTPFPQPHALQKQSGNVPEPAAVLPSPKLFLAPAPLCATGDFSEVSGCRGEVPQPAVTFAEAAAWKAGAKPRLSSGRGRSASPPSRVELPRAFPQPLESWLWLERKGGMSESIGHEVINPYPDKPGTPH
jgi:serine/threonine protein kinase